MQFTINYFHILYFLLKLNYDKFLLINKAFIILYFCYKKRLMLKDLQ